MRYAYSDLVTACMHAHMTDICAICNGDVLHGTEKAKRLRLFRDGAVDTREQLDIFLYIKDFP